MRKSHAPHERVPREAAKAAKSQEVLPRSRRTTPVEPGGPATRLPYAEACAGPEKVALL